jgi:hypothetical protein
VVNEFSKAYECLETVAPRFPIKTVSAHDFNWPISLKPDINKKRFALAASLDSN